VSAEREDQKFFTGSREKEDINFDKTCWWRRLDGRGRSGISSYRILF
jgi:hypothetical protein